MSDILIFDASLSKNQNITNYTIAFIHNQKANFPSIFSQLKQYFQNHHIPDHLLIIGGKYLTTEFTQFTSDSENDFKDIVPTRFHQENMYSEFVGIYLFNAVGDLILFKGYAVETQSDLDSIFRIGMNRIFSKGGLISAQESHHFVFPSGKHCDKFLRTGNVLVKSQDIFFIAFNLLKRYRERYEIIYCDTSSINSLAFALVELKRRLSDDFICPHIESYGSYKGFEESEFIDRHKALFLISSSTSANIIDRLLERLIELKQIVLIYCLNPVKHKEVVICDLHRDDVNKLGIEPFKTFAFNDKCELCDRGSLPVIIQGDVFLLEKPLINKIILKTTDAPPNLSSFVKTYHHKRAHCKQFIKTNFFETTVRSSTSAQFGYEIFFDIQLVFEDLTNDQPVFSLFKEKLNAYIHQYVSSNTRYIIYLNDKGSELFATYILAIISKVVKNEFLPTMISMNNMSQMDETQVGAALIVCSSMVSGGNLIYVSKEMRRCDKLSLIYLIGFTRTEDEDYFKFIKNNLCQGSRGRETNSFYSVETIHCNNDYKNTSWILELDFIRTFMQFCEIYLPTTSSSIINFFKSRDKILSSSMRVDQRGLSQQLFYPNAFTLEELVINKNFAFLNFTGYDRDVTQADIYFTISTIINRLRHSRDLKRCLKQSEYVRNLIDPENFSRFNDGIIQASILRSAHPLELAYDIDREISKKFIAIINPIIIHAKDKYGESLLEFLYAIAIKKLRIETSCLQELLLLVKDKCAGNDIVEGLCFYIDKVLIERDSNMIKDFTIKYDLI